MAIPPKLEGSAALLHVAPLFPVPNTGVAPAFEYLLTKLLANEVPPRIDVTRFHTPLTAWLGYPEGMLHIGSRASFTVPGEVPAGVTTYQVLYCCARYGRAVPVRELAYMDDAYVPATPIALYDAAPELFYNTHVNSPYAINSAGDGWCQIYDTTLAALS